jgi:hypothetical protein
MLTVVHALHVVDGSGWDAFPSLLCTAGRHLQHHLFGVMNPGASLRLASLCCPVQQTLH